MTRRGRATAVVLVLLSVLLGVPPAAGAADGAIADRVLVIGVPGLAWKDVAPDTTPHLWAMAEDSAIGAVSVRAARSTTCILDGWATLGAGNRARVPGPDDGLPPVPLPTVPLPDDQAAPSQAPGGNGSAPAVDTTLSHCGLQERAAGKALVDPKAAVKRTAEDPGTVRFGAEPGALGRSVGCATVSGRAPTLAVAVPGVKVTRVDPLPTEPARLASMLGGCPLTLVSLDQLTDAGQPGVNRTDEGTDPAARAAALQLIDRQVGQLRAAVAAAGDSRTLVLLVGVSEVNDGRPQLHVGMASGPGFDPTGWLTSSSTGRAPFVQLIDVAPTVEQALGVEQPASMNGQPMRATGDRPPLAEAVAQLVAVNTAATTHYRNTGIFFWTLVIISAALVALGMLVLGGVPGRPARPRLGGRRPLRAVAMAAAALPIATYLAGLVPWESTGAPVPVLIAALVGADVVVTAAALLGPWRRHRLGPALAVLAVTVATLLGDVLTGSTLELNGMLGYDAIVAGRFTGYGNLTFGLMSVSALSVAAALGTLVGRRVGPDRARAATAGTVLVLGAVIVGVIGAPSLGRDFGGVLAALPGFLVLAMLLARVRVTVVRLLLVLAAAVVAVGTVAVLDWLRPPADRSHLGRFVEQVLTGEAWTVISRKGQANLDILLHSPIAWLLPVAVVAAVWLVRPGGLLRSGPGEPVGAAAGLTAGQVFVVRSVLTSVLLSLVIGAAVNDSGVALPATAAALLVPLMIWLAAGAGRGGVATGEDSGGAPHSGPAEGTDRVTVVSRGSTVWNT